MHHCPRMAIAFLDCLSDPFVMPTASSSMVVSGGLDYDHDSEVCPCMLGRNAIAGDRAVDAGPEGVSLAGLPPPAPGQGSPPSHGTPASPASGTALASVHAMPLAQSRRKSALLAEAAAAAAPRLLVQRLHAGRLELVCEVHVSAGLAGLPVGVDAHRWAG